VSMLAIIKSERNGVIRTMHSPNRAQATEANVPANAGNTAT